jgi:hypothetical protein
MHLGLLDLQFYPLKLLLAYNLQNIPSTGVLNFLDYIVRTF